MVDFLTQFPGIIASIHSSARDSDCSKPITDFNVAEKRLAYLSLVSPGRALLCIDVFSCL